MPDESLKQELAAYDEKNITKERGVVESSQSDPAREAPAQTSQPSLGDTDTTGGLLEAIKEESPKAPKPIVLNIELLKNRGFREVPDPMECWEVVKSQITAEGGQIEGSIMNPSESLLSDRKTVGYRYDFIVSFGGEDANVYDVVFKVEQSKDGTYQTFNPYQGRSNFMGKTALKEINLTPEQNSQLERINWSFIKPPEDKIGVSGQKVTLLLTKEKPS